MTTLYLEAYSGVAGDMLLGALVDLGLPLKAIEDLLNAVLSGLARFSNQTGDSRRHLMQPTHH